MGILIIQRILFLRAFPLSLPANELAGHKNILVHDEHFYYIIIYTTCTLTVVSNISYDHIIVSSISLDLQFHVVFIASPLVNCFKSPVAIPAIENEQPSRIVNTNKEPTYAAPIGRDYMPLHPSTRSWEINRQQVNVCKVIGKGAFSQVAQATVRNLRGYEEDVTVAVKMLKGGIFIYVLLDL